MLGILGRLFGWLESPIFAVSAYKAPARDAAASDLPDLGSGNHGDPVP